MIEKDGNSFFLVCDVCAESVEFRTFQDALNYRKEEEWVNKKEEGEWITVCPNCSRMKKN